MKTKYKRGIDMIDKSKYNKLIGPSLLLLILMVLTSVGQAVVVADNIPPKTLASPGEGEKFSEIANISMIATDNEGGSGVNKTFYRINNGKIVTYTGIFTVDIIGNNNITYWSTDNASNVEPNNIVNFTILSATSTTGTTLGVENVEAAQNSSVEVPVNISNVKEDSIAGIGFEIKFDSTVLNLTNVKKGNLTSSWDLPSFNPTNGKISIVYAGSGTEIPIGSNGSVAVLDFSVKGSPGSKSPININNIQLSNVSGNVRTATSKNGNFTVSGGSQFIPTTNVTPVIPTTNITPVIPTTNITPVIPTTNVLTSVEVDTAPEIDGTPEALWDEATPLTVIVSGGANTGLHTVILKSVYTNDSVYFFATWNDPTESLRRLPWQKQEDGTWKQLKTLDAKEGGENTYYEDKFSQMWNENITGFETSGCFATCHVGENSDKKAYGNKYTENGAIADLWHMKLVRTNPNNFVDDQYIDSTRYSNETPDAGRHSDPGLAPYYNNIDANATMPNFTSADQPAPPYWILEEQAEPFKDIYNTSDEIAGIIIRPLIEDDRTDIDGKAVYSNGNWAIEYGRKLTTNSPFDVQFSDLSKGYSFGTAIFDNAQTQHSYQNGASKLMFALPTVSPFKFEFTVDTQSKTVELNEDAMYNLKINNIGNVADTYDLAVENTGNANVNLSTNNITVEPLQSGNIAMTVNSAVTGTFLVNVTATSQENTNNSITVSTNTTVGEISVQPLVAIRTIDKQSLNPGESTDVTVNITSDVTQALALQEVIPSGWNLTRITDDADGFRNDTINEWIWINATAGVTKTVVYKLSVPTNASTGTFTINGTITNAKGDTTTVSGNDTISIDIIEYYRKLGSNSNQIETKDLLTAIEDWRKGIIPDGFASPISGEEIKDLIENWIMRK